MPKYGQVCRQAFLTVMVCAVAAGAGPAPFPVAGPPPEKYASIASLTGFYQASLQHERGSSDLHPYTSMVLWTPWLSWSLLQQHAEIEAWTDEQFEAQWNQELSRWGDAVTFIFYPYSDNMEAVMSSTGFGSGDISKAFLQTSTGYQEWFDHFDGARALRTNYRHSPRYHNTLPVSFSAAALADEPEWLRVWVIVGHNMVYFEWTFEH